MNTIEVWGNEMTPSQQRTAKASYVHRFTGEHKPEWAQKLRPDGSTYPVQFKDDADWLANTEFSVTKTGGFAKFCTSYPTWPNNPELRRPFPNPAFQASNPAHEALTVEPS